MRNRHTTTTALAGCALATVLALTGCTTGDTGASSSPTTTADENSTATAGTSTGASPGAGSSGTPTDTASAAEASRADHRFARMMIPHHEQAIEMSDIILAKEGLDPDVASLAEEIKAAQGPEIEQMESWLEEWGVGDDRMGPDGNGPMGEGPMEGGEHGGMMGGMLSQDELDEMEQADTDEATRLFLEGMIEHHEGAIDMAEDEVRDGQYPDAVALAETIIVTQEREIETMRELLGR